MNTDIVDQTATLFNTYVVPLGWKVAGAIAVWIVGGWVIRVIRAAIGRSCWCGRSTTRWPAISRPART